VNQTKIEEIAAAIVEESLTLEQLDNVGSVYTVFMGVGLELQKIMSQMRKEEKK